MNAAVIPIKKLDIAKTRLAPELQGGARAKLVLDMLDHMLDVLCACPQLDMVAVATDDAAVLRHVMPRGRVRTLPGGRSLNGCALACGQLLAEEGARAMLFLHGDLPYISLSDIHRALTLSRQHDVVLMPDRHRSGTNGLLLAPPNCMRPVFGPGSLAKHLQEARRHGLTLHTLQTRGFAYDIDTLHDLHAMQAAQETG